MTIAVNTTAQYYALSYCTDPCIVCIFYYSVKNKTRSCSWPILMRAKWRFLLKFRKVFSLLVIQQGYLTKCTSHSCVGSSLTYRQVTVDPMMVRSVLFGAFSFCSPEYSLLCVHHHRKSSWDGSSKIVLFIKLDSMSLYFESPIYPVN